MLSDYVGYSGVVFEESVIEGIFFIFLKFDYYMFCYEFNK